MPDLRVAVAGQSGGGAKAPGRGLGGAESINEEKQVNIDPEESSWESGGKKGKTPFFR